MQTPTLLIAIAAVAFSAPSACIADGIQSKLGAQLYLNDSGDTIGITIPGLHEGFGLDLSIPEDFQNRFDVSIPHAKNDVLALPLGQEPNDLKLLAKHDHLKWVK